MNKLLKLIIPLVLIIQLFNSCATYKAQYNSKSTNDKTLSLNKTITHSFYLIGDAGNDEFILSELNTALQKTANSSTVLFLGNNADNSSVLKRNKIFDNQISSLDNTNSNAIFIPGSYEWDKGLKSLKKHQKEIQKQLGKHSFLPKNGCPIKDVKLSEDIVLILIDTEWYFADWDKHPTINDDCEIKTRAAFFDEFEGLVKKNIGKTTIVAMHRPLFSNGKYNGASTLKNQLLPIPIVADLFRKTTGFKGSDFQNKRYLEFQKRMSTLAQYNKKIVFLSGHEQSLQYLEKSNIVQIISGAGSEFSATKRTFADFTYGQIGYARYDVYKDGASSVSFFAKKNTTMKQVFTKKVFEAQKEQLKKYDNEFPAYESSQIYTDKEVTSGRFHNFLWGKRYRKYYGIPIKVETVKLDTLMGGLTPVRKGGGHQSKSLRLEDKNGKQYVMRALRKSGTKYLQAVAFKDQYTGDDYEKSTIEKVVMDIFTGSHPYAPFTIAALSDAVSVYHTNPKLYYIPKQNTLGKFNDVFGNELYMIEERASSGHGNLASFGNSNKVISTGDMYEALRSNTKHYLDEESFIRARLFDMLIGDWDRHADQWRWAEFKDENGLTFYRPIPRDRDQAFSIMSDGFLMGIATRIIPSLRLMQNYDEELRNPKWFNTEPLPLDITLTSQSNKEVWLTQATHIQNNLTDEAIDKAFAFFPDEVSDETITEIKKKLKGRRTNLKDIAETYYKHLSKYPIVTGTDKDDLFEIERLSNGNTSVSIYNLKKGEKERQIYSRIFLKEETKEIWIYGLDGKDIFNVTGNAKKLIKIRIIGGQGRDSYNIQNGKKVTMYDFKSKKSEFTTKKGIKKLKDDYKTNVYDHTKVENNSNILIPLIGSNPDDGLKVGISETYTVNNFERNPFTAQYSFSAAYFTATKGFELKFGSEFANIFSGVNFGISSLYQSPNYAINFFGFGNGTPNFEADDTDGVDADLNFNRVKIRQFRVYPSLIWRGQLGSKFTLGIPFETMEVARTENRFASTSTQINQLAFEDQSFLGAEAHYHFKNQDRSDFPTLGAEVDITLGTKFNIDKTNRNFSYFIPAISFDYRINTAGTIVYATKFKGHFNFGDDFEFYQAASIGGNDGLRGYRNQRFTGKRAYYQNSDLRFSLYNIKSHLLPFNIGVYGSFDYGRVWSDFDVNNDWQSSYGGGFWIDGAKLFTARFGAFTSDDGLRIAFGVGFDF